MPRISSRPILHIHIPKTGGQTFAHRIASGLPKDAAWVDRGDIMGHQSTEYLDEAISSGAVFISAHVTGEAFVDERRCDFVAFVRDPIEQIISNLAHVRREPANVLHPLLQNMALIEAMQLVPTWFFNVQSRYLISPFFRRRGKGLLQSEEAWLISKLSAACAKVHWLAPTESLEQFTTLFAAEMGLQFPGALIARNQAPKSGDGEWREVRDWLRANSHLYAVDSILYNEAKRRFAQFHDQFWLEGYSPGGRLLDVSKRSRQIFAGPEGTVSLLDGWVARQDDDRWGDTYHAGPTVDSTVAVSATKPGSRLNFSTLFVAGILHHELRFLDGKTGDLLNFTVAQEGDLATVSVDIPDHLPEARIIIRAPRIFPLCLFNQDWRGSRTAIAYAAAKWSISTED